MDLACLPNICYVPKTSDLQTYQIEQKLFCEIGTFAFKNYNISVVISLKTTRKCLLPQNKKQVLYYIKTAEKNDTRQEICNCIISICSVFQRNERRHKQQEITMPTEFSAMKIPSHVQQSKRNRFFLFLRLLLDKMSVNQTWFLSFVCYGNSSPVHSGKGNSMRTKCVGDFQS